MQHDKIPPYTVKGIPQSDRDAMSAAARRSQETIGQWIIEAGRQRIARERREAEDRFADVRQMTTPGRQGEAGGAPAPAPSVADLVLILRELANVPRCGQVAARARRLLGAQLAAHLPKAPATPTAPHGGSPNPAGIAAGAITLTPAASPNGAASAANAARFGEAANAARFGDAADPSGFRGKPPLRGPPQRPLLPPSEALLPRRSNAAAAEDG